MKAVVNTKIGARGAKIKTMYFCHCVMLHDVEFYAAFYQY